MAEFYLVDETHKSITGGTVELKGLLYFKHDLVGFDSKATKDHVKEYKVQFEEFKKKHPDFVLPSNLADEEIGSPSVVKSQVPAVVPELEPVVTPVLEDVSAAPAPEKSKSKFR